MKQKLLLFFFCLFAGINASAFYSARIDGIYYTFSGNEAIVEKGDTKYSGAVVIPESVIYNGQTYRVTSISYDAFWECSGLTSVTIPNSVTSIEANAFWECTSLTDVIIGSGVTSIGGCAFAKCSSLTSVTIPGKVTSIGVSAFYQCTSLTSITIPGGVTSIGEKAFYQCSGLNSIKVENGNTVYDSRDNCNALIETASNTLIAGCNNTVIPSSVTSIGYGAFYGCSGLTSVTIPNSVTSIGSDAFCGCSGLTSITIPGNVTRIGDSAFIGCISLSKVVVPDIAAWCGILFESEDSNPLYWASHIFSDEESEITDLVIPDGVTSIGTYAFMGCSGLTSVTIPSSVTSIGTYAFPYCRSLTSITIPNSVTSIGNYAFFNCIGLTDVYCYAENVPNTGEYIFFSISPTTATLHVPARSIEAYKATEPWSKFENIVAIEDAKGDLNGDSKIDIADAVSVLDVMAEGKDDPAADLNGDGKVDIADFVSVLDLMAGQ